MPKSQNIRQIAKDLNIGLDTFVFVDDNPFELDEVGRALPEVACCLVDRLDTLATDPRLQGSDSPEAAMRRRFYKDAMARDTDQQSFGEDYTGFLRSCRIVLEIRHYRDSDFDRVAELVQRTNQLNFSGRKYDRDQVRAVIDDPTLEKWVLRCSDRYGSYGTVGFCIARRSETVLCVQDFMLSCRVQGKFIEQALFAFLLEQHPPGQAAQRIIVRFRPTPRNTPARNVLEALGFRDMADDGFAITVPEAGIHCDFIEIVTDQTAEAVA